MKIIGVYYLYQLLFLLMGLTLLREFNHALGACSHRFAIFVPAHNEENVIAGSLRSITNCLYPADLFDVYVVADNCTDQTAARALQAGANVLERSVLNSRGKQHALKWAFEQIDLNEYDAVVILDADNHIDPHFLRVLDRHLSDGANVVQGYVETQNPCDSWVTANYAYMFWYICRLQMARTMIGLSSWLAGTGYCIKLDLLKKVGFNVATMTDDVEYTCQLILAGERVVFAQDAIVYDQKPVGLADSMKQRLRWIRGQTQVTVNYVPRLALAAVRYWWHGDSGQALRSLDAIMWVPMHLVVFASVVISVQHGWWQYLLSIFLTTPVFYMLPMLAERIKRSRSWLLLWSTGAFFLTWLPITAYGVISCGNKAWWRTPHI